MTPVPPPITPVPCCPLCGATRRELLHNGLRDLAFGVAGGRWSLWRCTECGAAFLDPRPADEALSDLYATYYTHDVPAPNLVPATRAARAARALRNGYLNGALGYGLRPASRVGLVLGRSAPPFRAVVQRAVRGLPAGSRVLDIGCGNGLFVAEACAWGLRASGIDLDAAGVAAGRGYGLDLATESPAERALREPGAYDAVTLSHVIEHVADPVALLRHCAVLLRPGGTLWVATPNLAASGHRRFGAAWLHLDPPRHLVLFDARALAAAVAVAGFIEARVQGPVPNAVRSYAASAAIARDEVAGNEPPAPSSRTRVAAIVADLAAQLRREGAEELVMVARRP